MTPYEERRARQNDRARVTHRMRRKAGMCIVCSRRTTGARCDRCRARRNPGRLSGYLQIDAVLSQLKVVALRRLTRFDWVTVHDLASACEIADGARNSFAQAVCRLVDRGSVESRRVRGAENQVRITAAGRAELSEIWASIAAEIGTVEE